MTRTAYANRRSFPNGMECWAHEAPICISWQRSFPLAGNPAPALSPCSVHIIASSSPFGHSIGTEAASSAAFHHASAWHVRHGKGEKRRCIPWNTAVSRLSATETKKFFQNRKVCSFLILQAFILNTKGEIAWEIKHLEQRFLQKLNDNNIAFIRNGGNEILPGLIGLSFEGKDGEAILHRMDLMGISLSTGSACNSRSTQIIIKQRWEEAQLYFYENIVWILLKFRWIILYIMISYGKKIEDGRLNLSVLP